METIEQQLTRLFEKAGKASDKLAQDIYRDKISGKHTNIVALLALASLIGIMLDGYPEPQYRAMLKELLCACIRGDDDDEDDGPA